jgi:hypothetical protein
MVDVEFHDHREVDGVHIVDVEDNDLDANLGRVLEAGSQCVEVKKCNN